jgi:protease II
MSVGGTRDNDWIMISIHDHETSEYRISRPTIRWPEPAGRLAA